ncbi:MAG: ABC transporter substrate-binding protein, partial [Elioraea sp.]|nr:ABC transporter substrate-binding protein [Elioraea sp.]
MRTTRRTFVGTIAGGAAASTLPLVAVHGQPRVTLRCGFWDHWVPAGNGALRELCAAWGARER